MRIATCRCGALKVECSGEPVRVSVCHCLECQRRTGSAFSAQARFEVHAVAVTGPFQTYVRIGDAGSTLTYQFCPDCGATLAYRIDAWPNLVAVPLGAFGKTDFPVPTYSAYERSRHPWVSIVGDEISRFD